MIISEGYSRLPGFTEEEALLANGDSRHLFCNNNNIRIRDMEIHGIKISQEWILKEIAPRRIEISQAIRINNNILHFHLRINHNNNIYLIIVQIQTISNKIDHFSNQLGHANSGLAIVEVANKITLIFCCQRNATKLWKNTTKNLENTSLHFLSPFPFTLFWILFNLPEKKH
jgi:hypothetical protein